MNRIRLLLVTDNSLLQDGIVSMLKQHREIAVEVSPADKENILKKALSFKPNQVLFDAELSSDVCRLVMETTRRKYPGVTVIVVGITAGGKKMLEFVKVGVSGFITKGAHFKDFLTTIRQVDEGMTVLPPSLTESLFLQIEKYAVINGLIHEGNSVHITKREHDIIELMREGLTNRDIGRMLGISADTVGNHVHNILLKMSVHRRGDVKEV